MDRSKNIMTPPRRKKPPVKVSMLLNVLLAGGGVLLFLLFSPSIIHNRTTIQIDVEQSTQATSSHRLHIHARELEKKERKEERKKEGMNSNLHTYPLSKKPPRFLNNHTSQPILHCAHDFFPRHLPLLLVESFHLDRRRTLGVCEPHSRHLERMGSRRTRWVVSRAVVEGRNLEAIEVFPAFSHFWNFEEI